MRVAQGGAVCPWWWWWWRFIHSQGIRSKLALKFEDFFAGVGRWDVRISESAAEVIWGLCQFQFEPTRKGRRGCQPLKMVHRDSRSTKTLASAPEGDKSRFVLERSDPEAWLPFLPSPQSWELPQIRKFYWKIRDWKSELPEASTIGENSENNFGHMG